MHANTAQKKFSDTFFKEFGKPADGHKWGFDKPWVEKYLTRVDYSTSAKVIKVDSKDEDIPVLEAYGTIPNISQKEHEEVYEWFSTHQVTWTTKTTNYDPKDGWGLVVDGYEATASFIGADYQSQYYTDYNHNYNIGDKLTKESYNLLSAENKEKCKSCVFKGTSGTSKYLAKFDSSGNEISGTRKEGDFYVVVNNNPGNYITQRAGNNTRLDGVSIARAVNGGTPSTSSLYTNSPDKIGDTSVGITIDFNNAWIQHVAGESDSKIPDWCKEKTSFGDEIYSSNNYNSDGSLKSSNMDFIQFYDPTGVQIDINDFNGVAGWGWNRQTIIKKDGHLMSNEELQSLIRAAYEQEYEKTRDYNLALKAAKAKCNEIMSTYGEGSTDPAWYNNFATAFLKNAVLLFGADFSQTTYNSTIGTDEYFVQDKWILVYLKGDGYQGWYMGFDLEAAGPEKNHMVEANGFCNNWIIKLTAVNEAVSTEPVRIMCEDLGGEENEVHIGDKVHISDIDYNDIVLDVTPDNTNRNIELKLQAAGGTIPLTVWYNKRPLFETHEMFQAEKTCSDENHKVGIDYTIMYNTHGDNRATTTDGVEPRTYNLKLDEDFDINKLELKVWRLDTEQYIESAPNDFSDALWLNISNIAGEAPLKICVNQKVPWLKERCSIKDGYPKFREWVQDPSKLFWGSKETPNIIDYSDKAVEEFLVVKK